MNDRVSELEYKVKEIEKGLLKSYEKHVEAIDRFAGTVDRAMQFQERMVTYQKDSLPISQVMRLFTFFAMLVVAITGSILGLKWIALDIFNKV